MYAPLYRRASFTGERVTLANDRVRVEFCKRLCGWGFGEIYTPAGRLMAVLDHFGELAVRDCEIPMRIEGASYTLEREGDTQVLTFPVETTMTQQKLVGTSFENWVHFPFVETCLSGWVKFTLRDGESAVGMRSHFVSNANLYVRYLRGVWVLAGEASYGTAKTDSMLPGVDWTVGEEWSSGTDFFKDPWANRSVPHPNKVTAPVMAVSHEGDAVSVCYDPAKPVTRWFNYNAYYPQPVFATPNFIERMNNSLCGLMIPDVKAESEENKPFADVPMELHIGQHIDFEAEIAVTCGNSLDALVDWVGRHGMPAVEPKWTDEEALDKIANAYDTNLWHEGEGWGTQQRPNEREMSRRTPAFLRRYAAEHAETPIGKSLAAKIAWADAAEKPALRMGSGFLDAYTKEEAVPFMDELRARCETILTWQHPDGSFAFEPDGRHYTKDDFRVARGFIEPMGLDGDTALHMNTVPAFELLLFYRAGGDAKYAEAAKRALDFALPYIRPEAGDYWECPLHSPNLLAAGLAMNAYRLAYELFGDERYREKSVYWLRALLAFTHMWEPANMPMKYDTKPCLCSSDWYFANWVRDHVQWEVLASFGLSAKLGYDWAKLDPALDWRAYEYGVTVAAYHWMADGKTGTWRPHNIPESYERYLAGEYDTCYADTHNTMTGNLGGMLIMPEPIADGLYALIDRK